jgi:hypothetical protein
MMWNHLYELWQSVLRRPPPDEPPAPAPPVRDAMREDLRHLLEERSALQNTAASYREFGYEELARRFRDQVAALTHRIAALRIELRRRASARRA